MFEYLDFLQTPNPNFNNMPICPFIKGDLHTDNIKFMVYNSTMDTSLIEMIQEWEQSDFKTGLVDWYNQTIVGLQKGGRVVLLRSRLAGAVLRGTALDLYCFVHYSANCASCCGTPCPGSASS